MDFTYSILAFCIFAVFSSSSANFLFRVSIFVNCHVDSSLGDRETAKLHSLLSVQGLSNGWPMTNPGYSSKEAVWLIIDHDVHRLFTQ